ncbi:hypothetical protein JCM24511_04034 [Saitozyma sp. JCM 24511]|nr:hypothetical protein JCM24511_04034 [Saitozyma sp. JCM 24511]
MSRPCSSLVFLALCACALLGQCLAATTDQQCLDACSDYSISIGHCRDVYGNELLNSNLPSLPSLPSLPLCHFASLPLCLSPASPHSRRKYFTPSSHASPSGCPVPLPFLPPTSSQPRRIFVASSSQPKLTSPAEYQNYTEANAFVACLCTGEENDGASFGNASIQASVGICESCASTPDKIKEDLSALLSLCTIQLQNGTAADALSFRPQSYKTAESPDVASIVDTTSGSVRRFDPATISTIYIIVGVATGISAAMAKAMGLDLGAAVGIL